MNPCSSDQGGTEDYSGSEPLDPALADRFALIVHRGRLERSHEPSSRRRSWRRRAKGASRRRTRRCDRRSTTGARRFVEQANACPAADHDLRHAPSSARSTARACASRRGGRGCSRAACSPRRSSPDRADVGLVHAACSSAACRTRPGASPIEPAVIAAAHRAAWDASPRGRRAPGSTRSSPSSSLHRKLAAAARSLHRPGRRARRRSRSCSRTSRRSAPRRSRSPSTRRRSRGKLPIGAEGVNDLAKIAVPLLDVEGEISWQERLNEQGTSHPRSPRSARCWRRCATAGSRAPASSSRPASCEGIAIAGRDRARAAARRVREAASANASSRETAVSAARNRARPMRARRRHSSGQQRRPDVAAAASERMLASAAAATTRRRSDCRG